MGSPIRLLLADDHRLFRQVLRRSLAGHARFEVVGEVADTDEAIREARSLRPDMVLMDLEMPGDGGVAATRTLRAQMPGVEVVIVTGSEEQDDLRAALAAGAKGYVLKSSDYGALIASLEALAEGEAATLPNLTPAVSASGSVRAGGGSGDHFAELSERELQVIRLLAEGASNRTIASQLCLSENTVRTYVAHILEKLGLENRVQAAAYALRHGLVS
jgi:two-component system, NarL family, nitrate/nitrite response regulator NarL